METATADLRDLTGVIPPMITPFAEDDSIDHALLRREARFLLSCGIDGLVVGGSTGEGAGMSAQELGDAVRTVIDAVEGSIPVLAGIIADDSSEAVRLGESARKAGAAGLQVPPPHFYFSADPHPGRVLRSDHRRDRSAIDHLQRHSMGASGHRIASRDHIRQQIDRRNQAKRAEYPRIGRSAGELERPGEDLFGYRRHDLSVFNARGGWHDLRHFQRLSSRDNPDSRRRPRWESGPCVANPRTDRAGLADRRPAGFPRAHQVRHGAPRPRHWPSAAPTE